MPSCAQLCPAMPSSAQPGKQVAQEILGTDAPLKCQQTPFPSVPWCRRERMALGPWDGALGSRTERHS